MQEAEKFLESDEDFVRPHGDILVVDVMRREIELTLAKRNSSKSKALRSLDSLQKALRQYDALEEEWTDTELDEQLESKLAELVKNVHSMLAHADNGNRLIEDDDILRLTLEKPIGRNFG